MKVERKNITLLRGNLAVMSSDTQLISIKTLD
jgi:hypothetical protein